MQSKVSTRGSVTVKSRRSSEDAAGEEEKDEVPQVYKNRIMVHDIHRVRELSALLEERRRYFDGQLGEVYRNAGVSSPNVPLPRLRGRDSPPPSASPSDSNVTGMSLIGSEMPHGGSITDVQSAYSGRSYSIFADDECSLADSFEFGDGKGQKGRLGRSWASSSMLPGADGSTGEGRRGKFGALSKDSLHNEVMRTADLEKKLKARRSSLPLALEATLRRPLKKSKKKVTTAKGSKSTLKDGGSTVEDSLSIIASTLLTKDHGYPESSDNEEDEKNPRRFSAKINADAKKYADQQFSMTETLKETRRFDLSQDLRRSMSGDFTNLSLLPGRGNKSGLKGLDRLSWDADLMGVAPRLKVKQTLPRSSGSKSVSSTLAPILDYSPRSSLSTLSGVTYPKIAFSSLEKIYREEGDKSKFQLHPSSLLLKPVPKIDMNLFAEPTHAEPDYSHDFRYLSLLDALVPCFEPNNKSWRPARTKKNEDKFYKDSPYRYQRDSGLSRLFPP